MVVEFGVSHSIRVCGEPPNKLMEIGLFRWARLGAWPRPSKHLTIFGKDPCLFRLAVFTDWPRGGCLDRIRPGEARPQNQHRKYDQ
jgi:hypothetical protein